MPWRTHWRAGGGHGCRIGAKTGLNPVGRGDRNYPPYPIGAPLRAKRQSDREFAGLLGYNRDPAWQLPALRLLLPAHQSIINNQGEVEFDGLHFQDDLLTLFPNTPVTLRQSEYSEATAWIYLDDEILSEARARELRRPDGTYRTRLPSGRSRLTD
jgi:hypothetical protein